jgi:hypothetical protein
MLSVIKDFLLKSFCLFFNLWPMQNGTRSSKSNGLWCLTPLSTIFQLYRGGGNQSTQRNSKTYVMDNKFVNIFNDNGSIFRPFVICCDRYTFCKQYDIDKHYVINRLLTNQHWQVKS